MEKLLTQIQIFRGTVIKNTNDHKLLQLLSWGKNSKEGRFWE